MKIKKLISLFIAIFVVLLIEEIALAIPIRKRNRFKHKHKVADDALG